MLSPPTPNPSESESLGVGPSSLCVNRCLLLTTPKFALWSSKKSHGPWRDRFWRGWPRGNTFQVLENQLTSLKDSKETILGWKLTGEWNSIPGLGRLNFKKSLFETLTMDWMGSCLANSLAFIKGPLGEGWIGVDCPKYVSPCFVATHMSSWARQWPTP